ncbi:hypothetical protein SETIT_9G013000v2 [Setaria italica]|uniref:Uncharacterized protein n=1 Tax=Setaria italica TaxID=4555 RepID=A0A368SC70_SETIT|nr:hypothetical protein SETIT_9G013000v2 [Setaria italica]
MVARSNPEEKWRINKLQLALRLASNKFATNRALHPFQNEIARIRVHLARERHRITDRRNNPQPMERRQCFLTSERRPRSQPGRRISTARRRGEEGGERGEVVGIVGDNLDGTPREIGQRRRTRRDETRRYGRRGDGGDGGRAAWGVITVVPQGFGGYLRGAPGGLWRGGARVDKRDEGSSVILGGSASQVQGSLTR